MRTTSKLFQVLSVSATRGILTVREATTQGVGAGGLLTGSGYRVGDVYLDTESNQGRRVLRLDGRVTETLEVRRPVLTDVKLQQRFFSGLAYIRSTIRAGTETVSRVDEIVMKAAPLLVVPEVADLTPGTPLDLPLAVIDGDVDRIEVSSGVEIEQYSFVGAGYRVGDCLSLKVNPVQQVRAMVTSVDDQGKILRIEADLQKLQAFNEESAAKGAIPMQAVQDGDCRGAGARFELRRIGSHLAVVPRRRLRVRMPALGSVLEGTVKIWASNNTGMQRCAKIRVRSCNDPQSEIVKSVLETTSEVVGETVNVYVVTNNVPRRSWKIRTTISERSSVTEVLDNAASATFTRLPPGNHVAYVQLLDPCGVVWGQGYSPIQILGTVPIFRAGVSPRLVMQERVAIITETERPDSGMVGTTPVQDYQPTNTGIVVTREDWGVVVVTGTEIKLDGASIEPNPSFLHFLSPGFHSLSGTDLTFERISKTQNSDQPVPQLEVGELGFINDDLRLSKDGAGDDELTLRQCEQHVVTIVEIDRATSQITLSAEFNLDLDILLMVEGQENGAVLNPATDGSTSSFTWGLLNDGDFVRVDVPEGISENRQVVLCEIASSSGELPTYVSQGPLSSLVARDEVILKEELEILPQVSVETIKEGVPSVRIESNGVPALGRAGPTTMLPAELPSQQPPLVRNFRTTISTVDNAPVVLEANIQRGQVAGVGEDGRILRVGELAFARFENAIGTALSGHSIVEPRASLLSGSDFVHRRWSGPLSAWDVETKNVDEDLFGVDQLKASHTVSSESSDFSYGSIVLRMNHGSFVSSVGDVSHGMPQLVPRNSVFFIRQMAAHPVRLGPLPTWQHHGWMTGTTTTLNMTKLPKVWSSVQFDL